MLEPPMPWLAPPVPGEAPPLVMPAGCEPPMFAGLLEPTLPPVALPPPGAPMPLLLVVPALGSALLPATPWPPAAAALEDAGCALLLQAAKPSAKPAILTQQRQPNMPAKLARERERHVSICAQARVLGYTATDADEDAAMALVQADAKWGGYAAGRFLAAREPEVPARNLGPKAFAALESVSFVHVPRLRRVALVGLLKSRRYYTPLRGGRVRSSWKFAIFDGHE
jgi:hypothetical protein